MERTVQKINPVDIVLPKKKRVAAYARVSSGKDAMLHSLSAQVSYYSNYIQKHPGWEYVGVYADEALTGTKEDRAEFQRLLADCRNGKVEMIVTKSISRFARNTLTLLEAVRELKSIGIDVYFEKENLHSISGDGELMLSILASFAQEESRSVSENCKWRIRRRFQAGEPANWRFLFGYRCVKRNMVIEPAEAEIVRSVFRDYIDGIGVTAIARRLKAQGVSTMFGGKWTARSVKVMLRNEKYVGNALLQKRYVKDHISKKLTSNKGQLPKYFAAGTHEPIVEESIFQAAQALLDNSMKKSSPMKPTTERYPFSHKIHCMNCGKSYKRQACHGRVYWNCATFLEKGKAACQAKQIPEKILLSVTAKALGLPQFDSVVFEEQISEIQIPGPNQLVFLFTDGHSESRIWKDSSRCESWDSEARKRASERQKEYSRREKVI